MQTIFITGGTGYIGRRLIQALLQKSGYSIKALVRRESVHKLPAGCEAVIGDALDSATYQSGIRPATIFIHLVGVSHPSPSKKEQFQRIDLVSVQQAGMAAKKANIKHFIYLSVAQYPTQIMKEYQSVRATGETFLREAGLCCSFIRPWYVLGPGHWWPLLLKPLYWICRLIPSLQEGAQKLDTVTIHEMIKTLLFVIDHPPRTETNIYEVKKIRDFGKKSVQTTVNME